jgi:rubredoxin
MQMMSSANARALAAARPPQVKEGRWKTEFFGVPEERNGPQAFLIDTEPGKLLRPHFHTADQFQIVVAGSGTLGRHAVKVGAIHYAQAYTPYGPIVAGEKGLSYLTLRNSYDPGASFVPEKKDLLKRDIRPFQLACTAPDGAGPAVAGNEWTAVPEMDNGNGLGAWIFRLMPGETVIGPDPSAGRGQFYVPLKGSFLVEGEEMPEWSCVFVSPGEQSMQVQAGMSGVEGMMVQFPRNEGRRRASDSKPGSRKWECILCGFVYDEAAGLPEEGIAPGTAWEDVPATWTCPDCSAGKDDFEMVQVG